jgi:hypothetical protein
MIVKFANAINIFNLLYLKLSTWPIRSDIFKVSKFKMKSVKHLQSLKVVEKLDPFQQLKILLLKSDCKVVYKY